MAGAAIPYQKVNPLDYRTPIVDPATGNPTDQFIRIWQQMFLNGDNTKGDVDSKANKTTKIIAGTGLAGGGDLSQDRTLRIADTAVTPGTYGDASNVAQITVDQQGRLTAVSNVGITGGGGGGYTPMPQPLFQTNASAGFGTNNFAMTLLYADKACTLTKLRVPLAAPPSGTPSLIAGVYANNPTTYVPTTLLGQSPASTGLVANSVVDFTFASPIVLAAGTYFWIGIGSLGGGGSTNCYYIPYNIIRRYFGIASTTLPGTAPATSQDSWNGFSWWLS